MNYAGKFGADVLRSHSNAYFDFDSHSQGGNADTVTLPNAHLLFSGDYERSGADLIVSDRDHRVVVPNYFHGEKRPTLVSPEGAPLDPKVIEALTGHVAYAQAAGTPRCQVGRSCRQDDRQRQYRSQRRHHRSITAMRFTRMTWFRPAAVELQYLNI